MPMEIKTLKVTLEKLLAVKTNAEYAHDLCHSNFTSRYVPVRRVGEYIYIYIHTYIHQNTCIGIKTSIKVLFTVAPKQQAI